MSIAQTVCAFVALGIQHAMRMRRIVITVLPRSTYFPTLSHKRHNFWGGKNVIEHKIVCFGFSTAFVSNISHYKKK